MTMRQSIKAVLVLSMLAALAGGAAAQNYPAKPIRIVVPQTPGSILDMVARVMAPEMSKRLGQPIFVENRAGANHIIGYETVAVQSPADGYSIAMVSVPALAILPSIARNLRFDPTRDLPPFVGVVEGRQVVGSPVNAPWKTLREMVAVVKANPGKFNHGAATAVTRLPQEALLFITGMDMVYVPYSSTATLQPAFLRGDVHMGFQGESSAVSYGDKFRVLAVTGTTRTGRFPDAPTFQELGIDGMPGLEYSLNLRAGTPPAIVDRLQSAATQVLQQSEVRALFAKNMYDVVPDTSAKAAARRFEDQVKLFGDVAKRIGLQPE
jgi:tripartite-type tricarboxylate transporter receptor subunit TctC